MDCDPRRLTVLAAVARTGGVQAAGTALHVTPSAVSQQIAKLEREAGVSLMLHGRRHLVLTAAGIALAQRGERIAAELAGVQHDLARLTQQVGGPVTLVAFPTAVAAIVGPTAARVRLELPAVELRVVETAEEPATERLRNGTVDLVVVERDSSRRRPVPKGLREVALLDDPFMVMLPTTWPAPRGVRDLADLHWVAGPAGSATRSALDGLARAGGWRPRVVHEALEFPAVHALVGAELGAALVPRLALPDPGAAVAERVVAVPLPGLGSRRLVARHRTGRREPSPAVQAVLAILVDVAARRTAE